MSIVTVLLVIGALAFATVTGANNGGTLVAVQLRGGANPPWIPVLILTLAVGLGPVLLGTKVATTLTDRLAAFDGPARTPALAIILVASIGLVGLLSARGLPTSLFAALIGALTGVAVGIGLPVDGGMVGVVFLAAVVTPWIGAGFGWGMTRIGYLLSPVSPTRRWLARRQIGTFVLLSAAYGANGAQVMVALLALALGWSPSGVADNAGLLVLLAVCFAMGSVFGLTRLSASIGSGIIALRPTQVANAKIASMVSVGAAGAIGLPVSTTQVVTASLLGCGAASGYRRIRWRHAQRIALAWVVTVPAAFGVALVAGLACRPLIG